MEIWLVIIWLVIIVLQSAIWIWLAAVIQIKEKQSRTIPQTPVSIIVCAKNEEANLRKNLPLLLVQDHPQFEVLLVDDHSTDQSAEVIAEMQKQYPQLMLKTVPPKWKDAPGKKRALQFGLEQAQYEAVVLTDADCWPASNQWLRYMVTELESQEIVLGYAPYRKGRGGLNRWARFENVLTGIQYLGMAGRGLPYMGVGRNIGYNRKWLLDRGGILRKMHIPSGDDDLTVGALATKHNTGLVVHREAFVSSEPPGSFRAYVKQKSRHMKTGIHYGWRIRLALGVWAGMQLLSGIGIVLLLLFSNLWIWVLAIWFGRALLQLLIFEKPLKVLGQSDLLPWLPVLDIGYMLYIVMASPLLFGNPLVKWK